MTYTFIINPNAGRGRFRDRGRRLERVLRAAGLDYRIEYTTHGADAEKAAGSSTSDVVVAVGGDGTIHHVVSGLVRAGATAHLGVVPAGTGNDFVRMFELPSRLDRLVDLLRTTSPSRVDYGRVEWEGPEGTGSSIFVNVAGVGIDAKVAAAAARFKRLQGTARYLAGVLRTVHRWESPHLTVDFLQNGRRLARIEDALLLALVGNGCCAAGGFYLTPQASITDGRLDACVLRRTSVVRVLRLLPRVLKGGGHENEPEVTMGSVSGMHVAARVPLPVQSDGEVLTEHATIVHFEIVPGGLSVVMPVRM